MKIERKTSGPSKPDTNKKPEPSQKKSASAERRTTGPLTSKKQKGTKPSKPSEGHNTESERKRAKGPMGSGKSKQGTKGPNKKKLAIIISSVVVSLLVIGVGVKLGYDYYLQQKYQEKVDQIAATATDIIDEFRRVLTSQSPTTWIYDRDENLIMTLKVSTALQAVDTFPDALYQAVLNKAEGDPAGQVVSEYLKAKAIPADEGVYDGYKQCLTTQVKMNDIVRYLITTSSYGGDYVGATEATTNYFGLSLNQLNDMQAEFLAYTYRNDEVSIEDYLKDKNLNEDRLGLIINKSEYAAVRDKVLTELQNIEGIDVMNQSYMIKLSTSTQQQSILQTAIDQGMRQLIDLNGDNTYAFDCSIVVVDRNSGYARAYIPGRSCTVENAKPFMMNVLGFRDNFSQLYNQLADPYTFGFTLRELTKPNGDKELRSIEDLFNNQILGEKKSLDLVDSIDFVRSMYGLSEKFTGISMIYQITDGAGNTIYKAPGNSVLDLNNNNLAQFFSTDNDLLYFGSDFPVDTGIISFYSTADYILVMLAGSGAVGGSVTVAQREILQSTIDTVKTAVAKFYPTPVNPVWNGAGMDAAMTVCHGKNQSYVQESFTNELDELLAIEVNSFTSRVDFETKYESIKSFIDDYEIFVGEVYADSLRDALQSVRTERSEALTKFSVG